MLRQNGILVMNTICIANGPDADLYRAYVATLRTTFESVTAKLADGRTYSEDYQNIVLCASGLLSVGRAEAGAFTDDKSAGEALAAHLQMKYCVSMTGVQVLEWGNGSGY